MAISIKQKIAIAAIIFYVTFAWTAAAHAAIIKPANNLGLVGYWNLDEGAGTTAFGHSSSKDNGTLRGSTFLAWVRVYNRALSASEVQQLYNLGK